MNKVIKIICCIAAGLLVAGGILVLIGRGFGGNLAYQFLGGNGGVFITDDNCISETTELNRFTKLDLSTSLVDVELEIGDEYKLEAYAPENLQPEIKLENDKLIVKQPNMVMSVNVNTFKTSPYYKLTVPEGTYTVDIMTTSGNITVKDVDITGTVYATSGDSFISGVDSASLDLTSTSGNLSLTDCKIDDCVIGCTSGDAILKNVEAEKLKSGSTSGNLILDDVKTQEMNLSATSGDFKGSDITADKINIDGTSSNIIMDLSGEAFDYDYDISTNSGDIKIGDTSCEHSYKVEAGNKKKIVVNTTSGDIQFKF